MANPFTTAQAAQTMPGNDYTVQQNQLLRQQQMADLLRKQSMEPMGDTQTIGGWAIKKSPLEGLSKIAQALGANYVQKGADEKQTALANQLREQGVTDMNGVMGALNGSPETQAPFQADNPFGEDLGNMQSVTPAVKGDQRQAMALALNSQNPMVQGIGAKLMESQLKAPEWTLGERFNDKTGMAEKFMYNKNNPDQERPIGGQQAVKNEFVNGQAVNPYTTQTSGSVIPKQPDAPNLASDLLVPGPNGTMIPNHVLIGAKKEIARSGAPNVNNTVSIAGPENKYNQVVGEGLGKEGLELLTIAKQAPDVVQNAQMIRQAIKNGAITGTGAEARLSMQKALETAGIVGKGKSADTQALMAGLGKLTLAGIKTSGLGSGNGFTDKDRAFLQSAISGTIDSTPQNLLRVADLSEKIARTNYEKGSSVLRRWSKDPALGNVAQDTQLTPMPANDAQGGSFADAEKERRYQEFKARQGKK